MATRVERGAGKGQAGDAPPATSSPHRGDGREAASAVCAAYVTARNLRGLNTARPARPRSELARPSVRWSRLGDSWTRTNQVATCRYRGNCARSGSRSRVQCRPRPVAVTGNGPPSSDPPSPGRPGRESASKRCPCGNGDAAERVARPPKTEDVAVAMGSREGIGCGQRAVNSGFPQPSTACGATERAFSSRSPAQSWRHCRGPGRTTRATGFRTRTRHQQLDGLGQARTECVSDWQGLHYASRAAGMTSDGHRGELARSAGRAPRRRAGHRLPQ